MATRQTQGYYVPAVRGGSSTPAPAPAVPNVPGVVAGSIGGGASAGAPAARPTVPAISPGPGVAAAGGMAPPTRSTRVIQEDPNQYVPGVFTNVAGNAGRYLVDTNGTFLEGDSSAYAKDYAGLYPTGTAGSYRDAQAMAERNAAENNYGAGLANLDLQGNNIRTSFEELAGLLGRNKTKNLGSLADSMADRGLSNSGIFLNSTSDVNSNFNEQLAGNTRNRDSQLNGIERSRVDLGNTLNQQLSGADSAAYQRALDNWGAMQAAGLKIAQDRLKQIGLM